MRSAWAEPSSEETEVAEERRVNGQRIIAAERAEMPVPAKDGKPVRYKRIERLLLEDGSELFGCMVQGCGHVDTTSAKVRGHLGKKHRSDSSNTTLSELREMTIGEVLDLADENRAQQGQIEVLTEQRDHWKDRATKAEKDLGIIRRAIRGDQ